tara:strand:+ start:3070 stop:3597 length:528 start_codon:yes stop_codon:yes gene_type:complete
MLCQDDTLIKNPFICKSSVGHRLSMTKDPRELKDRDTNYITEYIGTNGNHHLISETNDKLSYCFGTAPETEQQLTGFEFMDYQIPASELNKTSKVKHKDGLPLSFLQIDNEVQGLEWYKKNYPKIPDELLPIIARYHWGEPITKKGIKNERKKIQKKLQSKGLVVENKKVSLSFN